jgi:peptide-methionine (R)-S-oxide reductase
MEHTDEEWRKKLTPEQYLVLRDKGTEPPYSGALLYNNKQGSYTCAACGNELFSSDTKVEAHCGWPNFYDAKPGAVKLHRDTSFGMVRDAVTCARCGGHLGHVFPDAPDQPTGQRFCVNSAALQFVARGKK